MGHDDRAVVAEHDVTGFVEALQARLDDGGGTVDLACEVVCGRGPTGGREVRVHREADVLVVHARHLPSPSSEVTSDER